MTLDKILLINLLRMDLIRPPDCDETFPPYCHRQPINVVDISPHMYDAAQSNSSPTPGNGGKLSTFDNLHVVWDRHCSQSQTSSAFMFSTRYMAPSNLRAAELNSANAVHVYHLNQGPAAVMKLHHQAHISRCFFVLRRSWTRTVDRQVRQNRPCHRKPARPRDYG